MNSLSNYIVQSEMKELELMNKSESPKEMNHNNYEF